MRQDHRAIVSVGILALARTQRTQPSEVEHVVDLTTFLFNQTRFAETIHFDCGSGDVKILKHPVRHLLPLSRQYCATGVTGQVTPRPVFVGRLCVLFRSRDLLCRRRLRRSAKRSPMHIQADRALIPAHTPAVRHLTVTITAPSAQGATKDRPAVNVAFVLDRSGSMDGKKIEMARSAVTHAIKLLNARDQFAVVVFDNVVDTILATTAASKEAKAKAFANLTKVDARGGTDLSAGWFAGAQQAGIGANGVKRVLLLTDGLANEGVVDHDELAQAAAKFREAGVTTSTFGVGADFDEELLARIATNGGGHFYFIEKAKQIPDFLTSELGETLETVARDATLDIACPPGIEVTALNGLPTETAHSHLRVKLGDLVADQEITLALAVSFAPQLLESVTFVDCSLTDRDGKLYPEPMRVEWRAADTAANTIQPVNQQVLVVVAELLADRARATALSFNRRGQYDEVQRVLRDVIEHLRGLAPGNPQVVAIIDRLRHEELELGQPITALASKARHFANYSRIQSRSEDGKARRRG
ncbi:MAG TPA: VWA domain-containing protein [Vicinamibacterales bacterium]|nr:VWA domain-containing protein [Vicinamibacterales bacterium]